MMTATEIKGSLEYVVTRGGAEIARSYCVNVDRDLYTVIIDGAWMGTLSHASAFDLLGRIDPKASRTDHRCIGRRSVDTPGLVRRVYRCTNDATHGEYCEVCER